MLKTQDMDEQCEQAPGELRPCHKHRARIALLSNPRSTGNLAQLPRIREYCADHPDIFHYEVESVGQIGDAMKSIARVRPKVLVINGGDGTVQATLTELYNGGHFGTDLPPVAVLPSGNTNLIALDLGASGDPIQTLARLIELARSDDLGPYTVPRELIALHRGDNERPIVGMFLGGAGLADTMIYCRKKIYPLGLPKGVSHVITALALVAKLFTRAKASFLPELTAMHVHVRDRERTTSGHFSLLAVTTLEKLLMSSDLGGKREGALKVIAVEERPVSFIRAFAASLSGKLGGMNLRGVHFDVADEITIRGDRSHVILDGETFQTEVGEAIHLRPAHPLSFVKLAA